MAEAEADRTGRGLVKVPDILFRLAERRQDGAGVLVEPASGCRQRDAARPSFEQFDAEIVFERGDVMAQRRLGDVEPLRRPRQHAGVGNGDEVSDLPQSQRHRRSLLPSDY